MASDFSIRLAARIINNGGVIAYPTDTIYGLGCNPLDRSAVEKLNRLKNRPADKHCILLASDIEQLAPFIDLDQSQVETIMASKEPTSWIIDAGKHAPSWLVSNDNTIAVRLTDNDNVKRLCEATRSALISTSANPSGSRPASNSIDLHRYFHQQIDLILLANKPLPGKASKLIRLCDNHVLRK